jgi:tetratricopeptide (TPR) repeat protein
MKGPSSIAAASVALLLVLPVRASAQKDAFVDAFVAFHSALAGTYGDEGPIVLAELDRMAAALDKWEVANAIAEAALKANPHTMPAEFALLYADEQKIDAAIDAMNAAIAAEPRRAPLYIYLGLLREAAGDRAEAVAAFETARSIDPADPRAAYLVAAAIAEGNGRGPDTVPEADASQRDALQPLIATLIRATDRAGARLSDPFPEFALVDDLAAPTAIFAPSAYADGFALMARRRFRDAIEAFRRDAAHDPLVIDPAVRSPALITGVAALHAKQGPTAVEQLESAVHALPDSPEAHRVLGVVYRAVGRPADAVAQFEAAVRLAPSVERARVALGSTLAEAGRLDEAVRVLRDTISAMPASGDARRALADVYAKLDRAQDALPVLDDAAALDVVAGRSRLYWRIAQLAHGYYRDHAHVIDVLARRTRLLRNDPAAHADLGLAYSRAARDDEALVELLMAVLLGEQDAATFAAIGQIHLDAGRYDRAEASLRAAIAFDAALPQAHYALARTLQRLGRTDEAQKQLADFERLRAAAFEEQRRKFETATQTGAVPESAPRDPGAGQR